MRLVLASSCLLATIALCGCASLSSEQPPARLTAGFWFWEGSSVDPAWAGQALDVLYVQVGVIREETSFAAGRGAPEAASRWVVSGRLPSNLPRAKTYFAVLRYARQGVPDVQAAPLIARQFSEIQSAAIQRNLNLAGVQLDIDSPTRALPQYAAFLREVRNSLPRDLEISITALLDWFRDGMAIAEVIKEVDEFVPQFYDLGKPETDTSGVAIASKIDAVQWGPVFNRFWKPFRIGVSTFGRARELRREIRSDN